MSASIASTAENGPVSFAKQCHMAQMNAALAYMYADGGAFARRK